MAAEPRPRARARGSAPEPAASPPVPPDARAERHATRALRSGEERWSASSARAFVDLAALTRRLAERPWVPLRLTGGADRLAQVACPRLPPALLLHVAHRAPVAAAGWLAV